MSQLPTENTVVPPVEWIAKLAAAATIHAVEQHACGLPLNVSQVDAILDAERARAEPSQRSSLVACYGAWLGEWLVLATAGEWCGLFEPVPPRVKVGSLFYSPMDAIERRLCSLDSPTLATCITAATDAHRADAMAGRLSAAARHAPDLTLANQVAWDDLADDPRYVSHSFPINQTQAEQALDPWLRAEGVLGKKILCLAAGGGTHAPMLTLAGGQVTVVDLSAKMLQIDRLAAHQLQLELNIHQGTIEDLSLLADTQFDMAVQPVSMNYLSQPEKVYQQVARVLRPHGLYVAQYKSPSWLQCRYDRQHERYWLAGHPGEVVEPNHAAGSTAAAELIQLDRGTVEIAHSLDVLLGGLCRTGFVIEDIGEPARGDAWAPMGEPAHQALVAPPYIKLKARRRK